MLRLISGLEKDEGFDYYRPHGLSTDGDCLREWLFTNSY